MVVIIYGFIGCKEKASTRYSKGFPMVVTLGQQHNAGEPLRGIQKGSPMVVTLGQQYNVGEKPTVILYNYFHHHGAIPNKTKTDFSLKKKKKTKYDNLGLQLTLFQPFGGNIDCKGKNS